MRAFEPLDHFGLVVRQRGVGWGKERKKNYVYIFNIKQNSIDPTRARSRKKKNFLGLLLTLTSTALVTGL